MGLTATELISHMKAEGNICILNDICPSEISLKHELSISCVKVMGNICTG